MNISSLQELSSIFNMTPINNTTNTQKTDNEEAANGLLQSLKDSSDSVSFSTEGMTFSMVNAPQEIDFENMSDEDFSSFLEEMQQRTNQVPGVSEDTEISELTSEQLESIREQLSSMSEQMSSMSGSMAMEGMKKMQGPPPLQQDIESMSDEDLTSLLEQLQQDTGSIPGIEDSESLDVSSLSEEQLEEARDTLMDMMQQQRDEMLQSRNMAQAISAYEATSITAI